MRIVVWPDMWDILDVKVANGRAFFNLITISAYYSALARLHR